MINMETSLCHIHSSLQESPNLLLSLSRSWFSKFSESRHAHLGLKISPAVLKSLTQAAEAGIGVLSFSDKFQTAGKDFRYLYILQSIMRFYASD